MSTATTQAPVPSPLHVVKDHYAAAARGDLAGMLAPLADGAVWTEAAGFPYAGRYVGREAIVAGVFARIAADWDGFGFEPDRFVADGDTVVATGRYFGRARATSLTLDARTVHIWTVVHGRVTAFEQVTDTHLVQRALGVITCTSIDPGGPS